MHFLNRVSLKTKLAAVDLHRLISDVRRRVEHEITFEGNEKRTTYVIFPMIFVKLHADLHFSDLSPLFFHPHPRRSIISLHKADLQSQTPFLPKPLHPKVIHIAKDTYLTLRRPSNHRSYPTTLSTHQH